MMLEEAAGVYVVNEFNEIKIDVLWINWEQTFDLTIAKNSNIILAICTLSLQEHSLCCWVVPFFFFLRERAFFNTQTRRP